MTKLSIRHFPDPILKKLTQKVERIDARVGTFIEQMIAFMRASKRCVGLAAPQVGSALQIAVMDGTDHPKVPDGHGLIVMVNPQVLELKGRCVSREGCLSIPDFTANVHRATSIRFRAFDQYGEARVITLAGFEAIIAQHEIDHLNGGLFLDRVANLKTDVFRRKQCS